MASQIPGFYTVIEAAEVIGRDPMSIYHFIRTGQLKAKRVGSQYIIEQSDAHKFTPNPPGNPNFRKNPKTASP